MTVPALAEAGTVTCSREKTQAELIEELCYMRAEVAYLKELKALSQKQTEKDKAKPSKY